jgi:hypothetical protein
MDSFDALPSLIALSLDETDAPIMSTERAAGPEESVLVDSDSKSSGYYPTYCVVA